jgi:hypothetical protein
MYTQALPLEPVALPLPSDSGSPGWGPGRPPPGAGLGIRLRPSLWQHDCSPTLCAYGLTGSFHLDAARLARAGFGAPPGPLADSSARSRGVARQVRPKVCVLPAWMK